MSVNEVKSFAQFLPSAYEAARAVREGREDLPEVKYPRHSWPANDAPDYMWRAMRMWHRWATRVINRLIDDDFRRQMAEEFQPPMDKRYVRWFADVLHDKLFRENRDYLSVLLLSCALYEDDAQGIAEGMAVVLDSAGKGSPDWARLQATWQGIRAIQGSWEKGKPKDDFVGYLRASVAKDASSRANRYGEERPNDPIRLAGDERLSGEILEKPPGPGRGHGKDQKPFDRGEELAAEDFERIAAPSHETVRLL